MSMRCPVGWFSKKNAHLVGQLRTGPHFMGQIGSGVRVSASFQKCTPRGLFRVKTPPRGRQDRCSAGGQGLLTVSAESTLSADQHG